METRGPEHDLSNEQDSKTSKEIPEKEQSEDWDLKELSNQNKLYWPYRDPKSHVVGHSPDDDASNQSKPLTASPIDSKEIRTRVKKSLEKKQREMRRRKRGESSAVTRSRRENREAVNHGAQAWNDGW